MKQIAHALIVAVLFTFQSDAQNIISNGSFEINNLGNSCALLAENAEGWEGINTIDLYNQTIKNCIPKLNYGHYCGSSTIFGNHFIGMRVRKIYKEFIINKLATSLTEGEEYRFTMYVKRRKGSRYYFKNFGIAFSEEYPGRKSEVFFRMGFIGGVFSHFFPYKKREFHSSKNKKILRNHKEWKQITIDFTAKGGEQYIVIGYFDANKNIRRSRSSQNLVEEAYYFIDNISLAPKISIIKEKGLNAIN